MKRSFEQLLPLDSHKSARLPSQLEAARMAASSLLSQWEAAAPPSPHPPLPSPPASSERTLSYSREQVGRIIGPAGKTIQQIRAASGCRVKISNELLPHLQQAVTFGGTAAQLDAALRAIDALLGAAAPAAAAAAEPCGGAPTEVRQAYEREQIGRLIGAGGARIQQLRARSGARIQISNEKVRGTNAQPVTISGSSEAVRAALDLIAEAVAEAPAGGEGGGGGGGEADESVSVPHAVMGRVIGPSGAVIKAIREKSGARVQVGNDRLPGTQDQLISLWGSPDQIQSALTMIHTIVATAAAECLSPAASGGGAAAAAGETTQTFTVSKEVVKRIIGPGGATIQRVREASGARVKVGNEPIAGTAHQPLTLTGTETQVETALAMVHEIAANPLAPGAAGGGGGGGGGGAGKVEERHAIPAALVGRVIGHGGDTIKRIREHSGCKVVLANETIQGTDDHQLTLVGTAAEVQLALMMVNTELQASGGMPLVSTAAYGAAAYGFAAPPPPGYPFAQPAYLPPPPPGYMLVPAPQPVEQAAQYVDPSFAAQYAAYAGFSL
ncbi:hypothetical protein AB1Y20_012785 [Prymnesium parvum]|uniref:K Homology domain-containing protein n=1 Tax=Prymnesium parvum TaxID=97485 RepID=A0AB34ILI0_PRYPA